MTDIVSQDNLVAIFLQLIMQAIESSLNLWRITSGEAILVMEETGHMIVVPKPKVLVE